MPPVSLLLKVSVIFLCSLSLFVFKSPVFASCTGCLCPGDPCNLCPLPTMQDNPSKPDEHDLCARIKNKVPPTSAQPGSNEYFPILDKAIMVCVNEGGDVIRNKQRNVEFPSSYYCKPPGLIKKN